MSATGLEGVSIQDGRLEVRKAGTRMLIPAAALVALLASPPQVCGRDSR
jgi:hypothetical protein